jgi:multisubunit Na+/H+ antiporter MnhF subunit
MNAEIVLEIATALCALLLIAAMLLAAVRIVRGPHVADRVVALDMLSLLGVASAALAAVVSNSMAFVDVALGVALVGFLATVAFAAFIERGSVREEGKS